MSYEFPHAGHVDDYLKAIEGREEFVVKRDETYDYGVINYLVNFEDTFPDLNTAPDPATARLWALRRDCRGLKFRLSTGEIISKPYHKFFNVGERRETLPENIDWSKPYRRFKKLDGSMITPLLVNGQVRFCTKMGLTGVAAPVDAWAADKPHYHELCQDAMSSGATPIFEWCSRVQRIVIDYPVTDLVLTAVRDNVTGAYMDPLALRALGDQYGITVAEFGEVLTGFDQAILDEVRACEGEEGDVLRWEDGHMRKLKGEWYCQLHRTLDHLNQEKDVIRLIMDEKLDDAKPFLPEDLVRAADDFAQAIFLGLRKTAGDLYWEVQAAHDNLNGSKKRFAETITGLEDKRLNGFKFSIWDRLEGGEDVAYSLLAAHVVNQLGTQTKVNAARHLWGGASWADHRDAPSEE